MAKIDRLIAGAREHLEAGEGIHAAVQGSYETKVMGSDSIRSGVLCATDRRILFYAKKLDNTGVSSFMEHKWEHDSATTFGVAAPRNAWAWDHFKSLPGCGTTTGNIDRRFPRSVDSFPTPHTGWE